MSDATETALATIGLFCELSKEDLHDIARRCVVKTYGPGEQIIDRYSESKDVFFILKGRARVVNYSLSGREITYADVEEGGFFGELAAIDGAPRSASVEALTEVTVATLSPDAFCGLIQASPDIAMAIIRNLVRIVRASTERIMDLSTLGANYRVMSELLREAKACVDVEDDNVALLTPIPVHSDIASRVSTTRETVARVISDLTKKGLLKKEKTGLRLLDLSRLEEIIEDVRGE